LCIDVFRLDGIACVITPVVPDVSDDGGELSSIQLLSKGLHGGACSTVEQHIDGALLGANCDALSYEGWERRRNTLTVGLVTGCAVPRVDLVALGHQLFHGPFLTNQLEGCGSLFLLFGQPHVIFMLFDRVDNDWHETMIFTA